MAYLLLLTGTLYRELALPCWTHLSPEEYRQRVAALVEDIESEAAAELKKGLAAFGASRSCSSNILTPALTGQRSLRRRDSHAATKAARKAFWQIYAAFVAALGEAAEKLKSPFDRGGPSYADPIAGFGLRLQVREYLCAGTIRHHADLLLGLE